MVARKGLFELIGMEPETAKEWLVYIRQIVVDSGTKDYALAESLVSRAYDELECENYDSLLGTVFRIGRLVGETGAQIDAVNLAKKQSNLKIPARSNYMLRCCALIIANAYWQTDEDRKIRISEMAVIVQDKMPDFISETIENISKRGTDEDQYLRRCLEVARVPKSKSTISNWIKDVAPPYARKGGRPTKLRK